MNRNPYEQKGSKPLLLNSVFIFMDILGYQQLVQKAHAAGKSQDFLEEIHSALSKARKALEDDEFVLQLAGHDLYALKAFTDNIVVGIPIINDGEIELGDAFSRVAEFQLNMILQGFYVRGAISVGDVYIDEIAVVGNPLTEAYNGESKLARDPRIILTETAKKYVDSHLEYYGRESHAPQVSELLQDSDGQWFVNYLDSILLDKEDNIIGYETLKKHKECVELELKKHKGVPDVFSKYAWVAGYHNYFCELHQDYFSNDYKIDSGLFQAKPKLITD